MNKKLSELTMSYKENIINSIEPNFTFNKEPINRFKIQETKSKNKNEQIINLKKLINSI